MSKFRTLDKYVSPRGQYELLPFRFEPLVEDEVVVTNYVGEFVFLKREQ
jgi:hypothetical protein